VTKTANWSCRVFDIPIEVAVPDDTIFISRNFIINIQQLKFEKPGLYAIDIAMDGRQEGSIPLLVKHMPSKQQQQHSQREND